MKTQIRYRKITAMLLLPLLCLSLAHCKKDTAAPAPASSIVGDWKLSSYYVKEQNKSEVQQTLSNCEKGTVYTFTSGGTIQYKLASGCSRSDLFLDAPSYAINGSKINLYGIDFDISFSGNTMTLLVVDSGYQERTIFTKN